MGAGVDIQVRRVPDRIQVLISGVVDETADLSELGGLDGRLEFNLAGLERFNSFGVRKWMDAMRALAESSSMTFVECSPTVIDQLNMINGFLASGRVVSFYGDMICDHCDAEATALFRASECRDLDRLPPVKCDDCGRMMELEAGEDQYLLFLREPTLVHG